MIKLILGRLLTLFLTTSVLASLHACSKMQEKKKVKKEVAVIETSLGNIVVQLYESDAPQHVANFKKLVKEGFYDSTTFHRVIPNFMIQGGDPNSKDNNPNNDGQGGPGYTIPAEIKRYHKRGALAAARLPDQINPKKASSGSQFYIVQNGVTPLAQLEKMDAQLRAYGRSGLTGEQKELYATVGGTPQLDGDYTVYGEVITGMDVVDKIAGVARGPRDNPLEKVLIKKITLQTMDVEE